MPRLVSTTNVDSSNPFHFVETFSSPNFSIFVDRRVEPKAMNKNFFEPLPFIEPDKQIDCPQLSQKHNVIRQMIQRKHRSNFPRQNRRICTFCKSNGESSNVYSSHLLRNDKNEIECPILMAFVCPKCGATGKTAHTIKYCPWLSENERVALPTVKTFKTGRSSSGNQNLFKSFF